MYLLLFFQCLCRVYESFFFLNIILTAEVKSIEIVVLFMIRKKIIYINIVKNNNNDNKLTVNNIDCI